MSGLVLGVPQTLSCFDKMQERIVRFVTENSGVGAQRFRQLMMNTGELVMDVGTVLDGEQAVEEGLIDELGRACAGGGETDRTDRSPDSGAKRRGNRLGHPFDYRPDGDDGKAK